ncbi:MAG: hypothetical protein C3F06_09420 [Candidatus Methanoperedenaceae archaeon]|nr:MAG: hypothetical protein C3F06_09420 [Candidatus Methanoperedenaceae archaeon]
MDNDTTNKQLEKQKDKSLENLERMLEKLPENARKPILDLINKRKVELGLLKSELKPLGYKLKKGNVKPKPKPQTKQSMESLRKIAGNIGRVKEPVETNFHDVDVKDEPLKKEKKAIEEVDSYKY